MSQITITAAALAADAEMLLEELRGLLGRISSEDPVWVVVSRLRIDAAGLRQAAERLHLDLVASSGQMKAANDHTLEEVAG